MGIVGRAIMAGALLLGVAACGDDDDEGGGSDPPPAEEGSAPETEGTEPPATEEGPDAAECASGEADSSRTITISVDDQVGGFGGIGSQTPGDLAAGTVRVVVEADAENEGPITVTLQSDAGAQQIAGVEPGVACGVDLDLAAGDYVVTSDVNDGDTEFTIVDA